jgi:hypothetical protein
VTPLCNVKPTIKGAFANNKAFFNHAEHEIRPNIRPGKLLKEVMANATAEKIEAGSNLPVILEFQDETSGASNGEITPGGMGILSGLRLSFEAADTDQGLFFIDSSGVETKVARIAKAKPAEVIFSVPNTLTPGSYTFALRTRLLSQEIREGTVKKLVVK